MSAGCAESGWARWDQRRHQGRKAGTVVPVRMLANAALPRCGVVAASYDAKKASVAEIMGPDRLRTFEGVEPMGRGRAKAKQVKVARQLKYKSSDGSDLDRLRAEIAAGTDSHNGTSGESGDFDDDEDDRDVPETEDAWRLGLAKRL